MLLSTIEPRHIHRQSADGFAYASLFSVQPSVHCSNRAVIRNAHSEYGSSQDRSRYPVFMWPLVVAKNQAPGK